ncbi:unnamed protein product [Acanthoscelides obtectus]|uniref:Uncharacterized protein n=1 Tax=Acanthoscelides obtectus TaxID=200917 RepID=A0A9P0PH71_ACAOB|nr:unnamed protein product [Acanthoscelides obtectus]CAK1628225.1 hypothetical protein AOBTE_LOCUS5084 [Acanthoscelides obtectus]
MYAAYPGGGPPPHYAPPPTFLQPHPPPPPLQHHVQVPPIPMVQSQSPVAHYSKKRSTFVGNLTLLIYFASRSSTIIFYVR